MWIKWCVIQTLYFLLSQKRLVVYQKLILYTTLVQICCLACKLGDLQVFKKFYNFFLTTFLPSEILLKIRFRENSNWCYC